MDPGAGAAGAATPPPAERRPFGCPVLGVGRRRPPDIAEHRVRFSASNIITYRIERSYEGAPWVESNLT